MLTDLFLLKCHGLYHCVIAYLVLAPCCYESWEIGADLGERECILKSEYFDINIMQTYNLAFFSHSRLRFICLTSNKLDTFPEPNHNLYLNKLQELYLSANQLGDDVIPKICLFQRLKILHLAYNRLTEIHDR